MQNLHQELISQVQAIDPKKIAADCVVNLQSIDLSQQETENSTTQLPLPPNSEPDANIEASTQPEPQVHTLQPQTPASSTPVVQSTTQGKTENSGGLIENSTVEDNTDTVSGLVDDNTDASSDLVEITVAEEKTDTSYAARLTQFKKTDYYKQLEDKLFAPINKEIKRLKKLDNAKHALVVNAKQLLDNAIYEHVKAGKENDKASLHDKLYNIVEQQAKNPTASKFRQPVAAFFKKLLGAFLVIASLTSILWFRKSRNLLFKPTNFARLSDISLAMKHSRPAVEAN